MVAQAQVKEPESVSTTTNEYALDRVYEEFGRDPEMIEIIRCESHFKQFSVSGKALRGITGDIGVMQVAPQYWLADAISRGYNIYTVDGNIAEAKIILRKQGKTAWVCYRGVE